MDAGAVRRIRYRLFILVALVIGLVFVVASRVPYTSAAQVLRPLADGFPAEEYAARCQRLAWVCLGAGLLLLALAAGLWLGRHRLPVPLSRAAAQFSASARLFRVDLASVLQGIAADRLGLILLLLLTGVGIAVRLWFLNQPMRYDESHTYLSFVQPRNLRLFYYRVPNNHVAHSLLVSLSTLLFGGEPWAIRLPAFLAGVLLIPATFLCARTVFHRAGGLVAAALAAAWPFLVFFSTNARGYSIVALLTLLLVPLTLYLVRKESWFAGGLAALLAAAGLFTIPVMLFPLAMLAVWALLLAFQAGGWAKTLRLLRLGAGVLLLCAVLTGVFYTPVVVMSGLGSVVANRATQAGPLAEVVTAWPRLATDTWLRFQRDLPLFSQVILALGTLAGLITLWKANRPALLLIPAALLGAGGVLLIKRAVPPQRTWLYLLPLVFCLVDAGLLALAGLLRFLPRRAADWSSAGLALLLVLGLGYCLVSTNAVVHYPETGVFPDAEAIARWLEPRVEEGDQVLARRNLPLRYYSSRLGIPLEVFDGQGSGDLYVVVQLPNETFERVVRAYGLELDPEDYAVETFPSALLYLPREAGG